MSEIHERIFNMIPDVQLAHIIDELATKITELNERIKLFVSTIYKEAVSYSEETFVSRSFVRLLIFYTLVERFCIERAFQKIRMHQRCKPECKIAPYAMYAFEHLYSDLFSE